MLKVFGIPLKILIFASVIINNGINVKNMVVTEFTYEQARKLIETPKVIIESDGKTVCK